MICCCRKGETELEGAVNRILGRQQCWRDLGTFAGYSRAEKAPSKMCPFQKCALQYVMWTKVGSPSSRYSQRAAGNARHGTAGGVELRGNCFPLHFYSLVDPGRRWKRK